MPADRHQLYEFEVLRHVEGDSRLNNRLAARKLGVSIRLAHTLLTRMVSKGLLHVKVVHARRWDYFLTPKGIAEKARLTLEFLEFSMRFYREARRQSAQRCRELAESGVRRVALLGAGELAEIVYLGMREWGLELEAVYDGDGDRAFMGVPTRPLAELDRADAGVPLIVCLYDPCQPMGAKYLPPGVRAGRRFHWVFGGSPGAGDSGGGRRRGGS
ncbi:MAG: hypothetical protein BWZ02_01136 [Lentisphaerae bacterium ADurb.BinA184]|nr:MAG: hypothetical protein BWZ02_01136 [Lentisphaerae bacterium ADurb.BinA184]